MELLIIGVILVLLMVVLFKSSINKKYVINAFKDNNVIVFGKKGTGKDMLFQMVINKRKQFYYSNISYGKKWLEIKMNDLSLYPNTYDDLINGNITKVDPNLKENYDIYISDGGVILPSQYDSKLDKTYPSLPIFYALQRHLYNSNTHVNTQYLGRLYKKLREQADAYIKCERVIFLFGIYIQLFTYYDRYETAERSLLPMKNKILNGFNNGLVEQYQATNGTIKPMFIIGFKKSLTYNTRYFKDVFLKHPDDINNAS